MLIRHFNGKYTENGFLLRDRALYFHTLFLFFTEKKKKMISLLPIKEISLIEILNKETKEQYISLLKHPV